MADTDLYGFPITINELQVSERRLCDDFSEQMQPAWMEIIEKEKLPTSEAKLKEMIRKGVPPTCRTWVWMNTSTAAKRKAAMANNYYNIMATAGATSPYLNEIEQDIAATFPNHPWFQSTDGKAAMKRVLSAYSVHNDKLGYCRSMNYIVGLLLAAMNRNEENAFWLLASLVEDILYPGTYSRNLEGCQVEMRALDELLLHKMPTLHEHLRQTECDISLIATDWYLSLFSTSMPAETVCRVWDALFNEGPKVLFRVALALLKLNEEALLQCNNAGDIVIKMRQAAASMHHREKLMMTAFDGIGGLPMATIDRFRDTKAKEVEANLRGRASDPSGGDAGKSDLSQRPSNTRNEQLEVAAAKAKEGMKTFMSGLNKWADKTANQLAKAAEKMGIKDDEPHANGR